MAKSIWKRGQKMTRKEKKNLRKLIPHPNRGRAKFKWLVKNAQITALIKLVEMSKEDMKEGRFQTAEQYLGERRNRRIDKPSYEEDDGPVTKEQAILVQNFADKQARDRGMIEPSKIPDKNWRRLI